jgi:hypothetical protein
MFLDIGFDIGKSLSKKVMEKFGLPENWRPKSEVFHGLLWFGCLVGAGVVVYLIATK